MRPVGSLAALALLASACSGPDSARTAQVLAPEGGYAPSSENPLTRSGSPSVWVADVTDAPVSDRSDDLVSDLVQQVDDRYDGTAAFNVYRYGTSTYTAPWWVARRNVEFDDCQARGDIPAGLYDGPGHFVDVPIPATAVPSPGTDGQLTIYSPETDQLWELWKARRDGGGWSACWGGRIDDVSESGGWFADSAGASASGLAVSAGAVTLDEARDGEVGHALSLAIPEVAEAPALSWPAQRTDGRSDADDAILMGQRFRLDPDLDVDDLGLGSVAEAVAKAAQEYGLIVTDSSGAVSVSADTGEQTVVAAGEDDPWRELLDGTPSYAVLEGFPWQELQALAQDWGEPAGNPEVDRDHPAG